MKVCVVGYGAMGKLVSKLLEEEFACSVALEGDFLTLNQTNGKFDCILDFSNPANLDMIIAYAREKHLPVVIATTGYSQNQMEQIEQLSKEVPVLWSSNFSLGVILMNRLVKEITPILKDDFDIEIIEAHHHNKIDSPSGTAKMLLASAQKETKLEPKYGREGHTMRNPKEIGVHSIRGGSIVGEHEILYCGEDEILSIKHQAQSKKVFALGAIKACHFLVGQKVGLYTMEDVLFK